jgi:3-oxoacyl-[acyl-carrier-protein] synthase III
MEEKTMTYPQQLKILGVGRYLPKKVVLSTELDARMNLEPGWIEKKQGVKERRWVEDETASFMGAQAAKEALADAGLEMSDISLILNASGTPEQAIPDGGPLIQLQLDQAWSGIPAFSIHATCLSFMVAMDTAANFIATGRYKNILIVSSDITSVALNFSHPESSTLFGDLAAAVVVGPTPEGEASCVHKSLLKTFSAGAYHTQNPGGGTKNHPNFPTNKPEDNLFHMEGPAVFKMAIKVAPPFLMELLGDQGGIGAMDLVIPHQASKLALDAHSHLGISQDKIVRTIHKFGNTVAASIPGALYEAIKTDRLKRGEKVLLLGTGAGLSIGAVIFTY